MLRSTVGAVGVDEVADELYGLSPAEFMAARTKQVKDAKAAKDPDLAMSIAALRKPSTGAWLANLATRERPEEINSLVDLGAALREAAATMSGPELKALSRQRHQVVYALVRQVAVLAAERGHRVTSETSRALEETFTAAVSDEAAGELLRTGRLTAALVPGESGLGVAPGSVTPRRTRDAPANRRAPAPATNRTRRPAGPPDTERAEQRRRDQERHRLERELVRAHTSARKATQAAESATEAFEGAQRELADAELEAADLQHELARAEQARAVAQLASDSTQARADRDNEAAERAGAEVTALQVQLDRL